MKSEVQILVAMILTLGLAVIAEAKPQENLHQRVNQLERKNQRLQKRVRKINQRILAIEEYLEGGGGGSDPGGGGQVLGVACSVTDSFQGMVFTGISSSQIDAEYNAYKACEAKTFASRCKSGKLACEDITSYSKTVCMVTDTFQGKRFRGEGDNELLAKANAVKACTKSTFASRCSKGTFKCENVY